MLPWLVNNFNDLKIIVPIRNPFAQISSQIEFADKFGGDWKSEKVLFEKYDFHLAFPQYKDFLISLNSQEEVLAAQWALNNKFALTHEYSNIKWTNVSYELLLTQPVKELHRLEYRLGIEKNSLSIDQLTKSSKTSISEANLEKWKTKLSSQQISKIEKVLTKLDMFHFYENECIPVSSYYFNE
jgi:hypothetical protein